MLEDIPWKQFCQWLNILIIAILHNMSFQCFINLTGKHLFSDKSFIYVMSNV